MRVCQYLFLSLPLTSRKREKEKERERERSRNGDVQLITVALPLDTGMTRENLQKIGPSMEMSCEQCHLNLRSWKRSKDRKWKLAGDRKKESCQRKVELWSVKACPADHPGRFSVFALLLIVTPPNLQNHLTLASEGYLNNQCFGSSSRNVAVGGEVSEKHNPEMSVCNGDSTSGRCRRTQM